MWRVIAVSACLLARSTFADLLIGPEMPFDDSVEMKLAVLMSPRDAAFAVVQHADSSHFKLIPMRDGERAGDAVEVPCAGAAASGRDGALVMGQCTRKDTMFVRFVSRAGVVSDAVPLAVPLGPLTPTGWQIFWTGREFIVLLTEYLTDLWYARFDGNGSPIGVAAILSASNDFVAHSSLLQTSEDPLLFVNRASVSGGKYWGHEEIYVWSRGGPIQTQGIREADRFTFAAASDGETRLMAAWLTIKIAIDYPNALQIADLDLQGRPTYQREVDANLDNLSLAWDGGEFILATPDGRIAAISSAAQVPQFVSAATNASNAVVVSGNGVSAILYNTMRDGVDIKAYRWLTIRRHRSVR
jgi:hypothetical protein